MVPRNSTVLLQYSIIALVCQCATTDQTLQQYRQSEQCVRPYVRVIPPDALCRCGTTVDAYSHKKNNPNSEQNLPVNRSDPEDTTVKVVRRIVLPNKLTLGSSDLEYEYGGTVNAYQYKTPRDAASMSSVLIPYT